MIYKFQSVLLCLFVVAAVTLSHAKEDDTAVIPPEELPRDAPVENPPVSDGDDPKPVEDDVKPKEENPPDEETEPKAEEEQKQDDETLKDDDKPIDKVEEPGTLEEVEEGSEGKVKIELRENVEEGKDDDNKGENIILKYVTDNPDVQALDLSNKGFSAISATMFQDKLENLKSLDLQKNVLASIDKNAFTSLPRLEIVNLSTNALTTLDPETFSGLPALQELDLSANPLELPSGSLFLSSLTLRRLRMAGCNLEQIPENTFDGMTSLLELDLGGNPIAEETPITAAVFAALTNLSYVILPESAVNTTLVKELCDSHGLLPEVCIESCSAKRIPCHPIDDDLIVPVVAKSDEAEPNKVDREVAKAELTKLVSETVNSSGNDDEPKLPSEGADLGRRMMAADTPPSDKNVKSPETKLEDLADDPPRKGAKASGAADETIPESSKSGVTGAGVNQTVIGLLVGGMIAVIAGVLLKKNWSKIRGKKDEPERRRVPAPRATAEDVEQGSEMVPLKNNNDKTPQV